jgi:hypothetical protein
MPTQQAISDALRKNAYAIAWEVFSQSQGLTPDEKMRGPNRLRWYIQVLIDTRQTDPTKIADLALGMMRQYEQIVRSKARVENEQRVQRKHDFQISIPSIRITSTQIDSASDKIAEQNAEKSSTAMNEPWIKLSQTSQGSSVKSPHDVIDQKKTKKDKESRFSDVQ